MILTAGLAVLLLVAAALILWGRKHYVGTDPHCRKCNYLLHGLESGRCPECGSTLSPEAIVHGERRRRMGSLVFGWVLILVLGSLMLTGGLSQIQQIDRYHYVPTYFVLRDLNSTNQASQIQAWAELSRRDSAGSLSSDSRNKLVLFAINLQANTTKPPSAIDQTVINYLGARLAAGDLPADQQKKICEQSVFVWFRARPKAIAGDPVPYIIDHIGQGPNNLRMRLTISGVAIDGQPIAGPSGSSEVSGLGGAGSIGSSVPSQPIGQHQLSMTSRIEFFVAKPNAVALTPTAPLLDAIERTSTAKFEVLPKSAGLSIEQINDPNLAAAMKTAISVSSFHYNDAGRWIVGTIHFNHLPANAAFEAVARYEGIERSLGPATADANCVNCNYEVMCANAPPPPGNIEILLRPSERIASQTVDMLNYWNQEIDFPNVPLPRH